jgi:hypothetical protein
MTEVNMAGGTSPASDRTPELKEGVMACKCGSENQKPFPADVKIYYDQGRTAAPPPFFPEVLVCLDCGLSEFRVAGGWNELQALRRAAAG